MWFHVSLCVILLVFGLQLARASDPRHLCRGMVSNKSWWSYTLKLLVSFYCRRVWMSKHAARS